MVRCLVQVPHRCSGFVGSAVSRLPPVRALAEHAMAVTQGPTGQGRTLDLHPHQRRRRCRSVEGSSAGATAFAAAVESGGGEAGQSDVPVLSLCSEGEIHGRAIGARVAVFAKSSRCGVAHGKA